MGDTREASPATSAEKTYVIWPKFKPGDLVRIRNVGCACDPNDRYRCWRHEWVGEIAYVLETIDEDNNGCFSYILAIDDPDAGPEEWFDDELEAVR